MVNAWDLLDVLSCLDLDSFNHLSHLWFYFLKRYFGEARWEEEYLFPSRFLWGGGCDRCVTLAVVTVSSCRGGLGKGLQGLAKNWKVHNIRVSSGRTVQIDHKPEQLCGVAYVCRERARRGQAPWPETLPRRPHLPMVRTIPPQIQQLDAPQVFSSSENWEGVC